MFHSLVFVKWFPVDDECCAPFSALASECNVHDTNVEVTSCRRQDRNVFYNMETVQLAVSRIHMLSVIERGKYKYLVIGSKGNSDFCFPETSSVSRGASN